MDNNNTKFNNTVKNTTKKLGRHKINESQKRKFRTTLVANDIEWEKIKHAAKKANCSINTYIIEKAIYNISDSLVKNENDKQTKLFN